MTIGPNDFSESAAALTDLIRLAANPGDARPLHDRLIQEARQVVSRAKCQYSNNHALGTTDLLHQALERTILLPAAAAPTPAPRWESREHFFAAVAKATIESLIDDHRRRVAQKRGGAAPLLDLDSQRDALARRLRESPAAESLSDEDRAAVAQALRSLEAIDPRAAAVVTLRFFYGLSMTEIAAALGQSERTIKRDWRAARAWLYRTLSHIGAPHPSKSSPSRDE